MAEDKKTESKAKVLDPSEDPGPPRFEDEHLDGDVPDTPLSAKEVSLESSRKNETSILATDTLTVQEDGTIKVTPV